MEKWLKEALEELGIKYGKVGPEFLEEARGLIERAEVKAARLLEEWKARHKRALEFQPGQKKRLREMWENAEAGKQKAFIPYLDYDGQTKEELAQKLRHILFDVAQGMDKTPSVHYENRLVDVIKVALIQDYLEAFILGKEAGLGEEEAKSPATGFEWIRETIIEAAKRYPHVTPAQIELESRELEKIAQAYFDKLASGIFTAEEIAADISKHKDEAKAQLLEYPTNVNTWKDGRADRDGKFALECFALVLPKLEAVFLGMKQAPEMIKKRQPEAGQGLPQELTFDSLFVHPSAKEELLAALRGLALIDGKGGLIAGKGKAPLRAAWDAAIQQGFLNETSLDAFQVFYSHFGATVSKSTFYEVPPKKHYPVLYKELLARLNRKK